MSRLNDTTPEEWDRATTGLCPPTTNTAKVKKVHSSGGSTVYYELPEGAEEIQDLIEYKKMDFAQGNVFKASYRVGSKSGIDELYDWKKIKWFAERKIMQLEKLEELDRKYEENNGIY